MNPISSLHDRTDFTAAVDARDFLQAHSAGLTPKQRSTLEAFLSGEDARATARRYGVSEKAVQFHMRGAISRLRLLAGPEKRGKV